MNGKRYITLCLLTVIPLVVGGCFVSGKFQRVANELMIGRNIEGLEKFIKEEELGAAKVFFKKQYILNWCSEIENDCCPPNLEKVLSEKEDGFIEQNILMIIAFRWGFMEPKHQVLIFSDLNTKKIVGWASSGVPSVCPCAAKRIHAA
jgi:hypothetical protein